MKTVKTVLNLTILCAALLFILGCPHTGGGNKGGSGNAQGNTPSLPNSFNPVTVEKRIGSVAFKMIKIEAVHPSEKIGDTSQGDNNVHAVNLSAYMIGETEVTQELWTAVMGGNPSKFNGTSGFGAEAGETQTKRPVELVSWYDCLVFCNELTKKTAGLGESECVYYCGPPEKVYTQEDISSGKPVHQDMSKKGFRLPTEAEWEWAARGGQNHKWPGTNENTQALNYVWSDNNSGNKTHEVKKKRPNAYGLYDMGGNVSEWCWDWYKPATPAGGYNPQGESTGTRRAVRGGHWNYDAGFALCYTRDSEDPKVNTGDGTIGFRIVCRP